MKKIRPAIFAMLLLIMVMSVTACGSNNSNTQSSTGALSVRQAQEALYQRSAVPSGCLYCGLGKNRPGHEILGPGAGAVHGTD